MVEFGLVPVAIWIGSQVEVPSLIAITEALAVELKLETINLAL